MDDREEIENKWREEFDELGEEGVREKLFRGTIQTNQRKEGFASRWLEEKRQEQEKRKTDPKHWIILALALTIIGAIILATVGIGIFWKA